MIIIMCELINCVQIFFYYKIRYMRIEIVILGEFGLIKYFIEGIKLENELSKYGVGDDVVVFFYFVDK